MNPYKKNYDAICSCKERKTWIKMGNRNGKKVLQTICDELWTEQMKWIDNETRNIKSMFVIKGYERNK